MAPINHNTLFLLIALLSGSFLGTSQSLIIAECKTLFEGRNFEKAEVLLANVKQGDPNYADALYYQGRIAVEEKKYELSIEKFEAAIEVNPNSAEYHNWLGVMYGVIALDAGRLRQAYLAPKIKSEFEKAAAIDPGNIPTQWGLLTYYIKAPFFLGGS